jgi:8-oxo-dGTP pyrophosphatase MutT (NUDIX family)
LYSAQGLNHRFAVVQRRKDNSWVLPKGKLKQKENAISVARREASEETGHDVDVREFLGVTSYWTSGRSFLSDAGDRCAWTDAHHRRQGPEMVAAGIGNRATIGAA